MHLPLVVQEPLELATVSPEAAGNSRVATAAMASAAGRKQSAACQQSSRMRMPKNGAPSLLAVEGPFIQHA